MEKNLESIVANYYNELYKYLYRVLGNKEYAKDMVKDQ
jgi:DNA-directed RNA polymerase specialized sigma24 family protein